MFDIQVDWGAIVIAAVLNMVIGFLWYSKWLFGPAWLKLAKLHAGDMKGEKMAMVYGLANSLVIAYFLAFFETYMRVTTVTDGMFVGFCVWLGFVATQQISGVIWAKHPFSLFVLDGGYKLVSLLV
ncbi:MAG: hypothetical protein RL235_223, partial [Chlamydiota bacterium]